MRRERGVRGSENAMRGMRNGKGGRVKERYGEVQISRRKERDRVWDQGLTGRERNKERWRVSLV